MINCGVQDPFRGQMTDQQWAVHRTTLSPQESVTYCVALKWIAPGENLRGLLLLILGGSPRAGVTRPTAERDPQGLNLTWM
jgi:hypothetical protein